MVAKKTTGKKATTKKQPAKKAGPVRKAAKKAAKAVRAATTRVGQKIEQIAGKVEDSLGL